MKLTPASKDNLLFIDPSHFSSGFRIISLMIFITGISMLFNEMRVGLFPLIFGLFFALYKEGIVFNLKNRTVSRYTAIANYNHFYKTKSLKGFKYLSIVRVGVAKKTILNNQDTISANIKYRLTLIKNNKSYFKVTTDEYFKVFALGKKIAFYYNLGLVDYSKRYAYWVIQPIKD